jgi:hypothetical protein
VLGFWNDILDQWHNWIRRQLRRLWNYWCISPWFYSWLCSAGSFSLMLPLVHYYRENLVMFCLSYTVMIRRLHSFGCTYVFFSVHILCVYSFPSKFVYIKLPFHIVHINVNLPSRLLALRLVYVSCPAKLQCSFILLDFSFVCFGELGEWVCWFGAFPLCLCSYWRLWWILIGDS